MRVVRRRRGDGPRPSTAPPPGSPPTTSATASAWRSPGCAGLSLASSAFSYEVNTTDADADIPVPTPLGTENLTLAEGTNRLQGDATFSVGGLSPPSPSTATSPSPATATPCWIGGDGVDLTLYAGSVQAVTLSSETADFTLGLNEDDEPTFALVEDSFTVSGFTLLPGRGCRPCPAAVGH